MPNKMHPIKTIFIYFIFEGEAAVIQSVKPVGIMLLDVFRKRRCARKQMINCGNINVITTKMIIIPNIKNIRRKAV